MARDLYEIYSTFDDYVKRMELARIEGVLLRYVSQVHSTLAQTVPASMKTEEVQEMIAYFRGLISRADSSLLEEWEGLIHPEAKVDAEPEVAPREYDLAADPPALRARIRTELQGLVRALSRRALRGGRGADRGLRGRSLGTPPALPRHSNHSTSSTSESSTIHAGESHISA